MQIEQDTAMTNSEMLMVKRYRRSKYAGKEKKKTVLNQLRMGMNGLYL